MLACDGISRINHHIDKNREPLVSFRWRKDADGYALDGEKIVRRGGRMIEYDPATVRPALHRVFAELRSHDALLAFVNEYGFLGSDRTGADAESEDVSYIAKQSSGLRLVMLWAAITCGLSPMKNSLFATGFVELERATGRIVPHLKPASAGRVREHIAEKPMLRLTNLRDALELSTREGAPHGRRDALVSLEIEEALTGPNLRMVFAPSGPHGRMQVHYEPESLYAWMWLRTAGDLTTGVDWNGAPCLYCMEAMGRGPGTHRKDAKFCSGKHRTYFDRLSPAEQRKRRKRAAEITRGQGAAEIDGGE